MSRTIPLNFGGDALFVVVVYDVDQKRCHKVMKFLRQFLEHRQRSVFTGFVSRAQVNTIQHGLMKLVKPSYDNVIIFQSNRADQIEEWTTKAADMARLGSVVVTAPFGAVKTADGTASKGRPKLRFRPLL